ncbi:hypothetical protein MGN70_003477 [Eutypa lata]|nr:hypothetical protein MGN70_003477 [Eutypa lata]
MEIEPAPERVHDAAGTATAAAAADAPPAPEMNDAGAAWKPTKRFLLAFMSLQVIVAAVAIESTSLPAALPVLSSELGGTALEAFWAGTSYLLASTVIQPTVASMSHILGRRIMLYVCAAGFAGGSLITALARNFTVVLVGRTIQGTGGGGIVVLLEILISDLIPLAHRGTWFSINAAMWSFGTAGGPLMGAAFAQYVSWRWIFWINLPIVGIGMLLVTLFLKQAKLPGNIVHKLIKFDWLGAILFSVCSAGFLFGITTGGVMFEWSSYAVLVPIIIGLAVLYYQAVKSYSPILSAVAMLPVTIHLSWASMAVGAIAGKILRYRWALWGGWTLVTLGSGILYLLKPETSIVQYVFLTTPFGLGAGMLFTAEILAIQAGTEPMLNGHAAAFFSFIRIFGQAIGVAVSGVIFQNVFKKKLDGLPEFAGVAYEYSRDATLVVEIIQGMPSGESKARIIQAYSDALGAIWLSLLAFSALAAVLSMTVKGYSMAQEHVTEQKLVQGEKSKPVNMESGVLVGEQSEKRNETEDA